MSSIAILVLEHGDSSLNFRISRQCCPHDMLQSGAIKYVYITVKILFNGKPSYVATLLIAINLDSTLRGWLK